MKKFKKIYVEITNKCNLNCSFCSKDKNKKKEMTLEEFEIVLKKIDNYTDYLYLHVKGEPLFHSQFEDILKLCKKYNKKINLTTNGILLKDKVACIIDSKIVRQINISLQSFNTLKYLNEVIRSVNELSKKGIEIVYRIWLDIPLKEKILSRLEVEYQQFNLYKKLINDKNITLARHIYLNQDKEFHWPKIDRKIVSEIGSCYGTRTHIGVLASGEVIPCCLDSEGVLRFGNIFEDSLANILNNPKFKTMKEGFQNNKIIEDLCKKCDFRTRIH